MRSFAPIISSYFKKSRVHFKTQPIHVLTLFINDHSQKTLNVTELSLILKELIQQSFKTIRVKGEISGSKKSTSGHIYFSLKDKNNILNAICWHGSALNLPLQIEDGLEVICSGNITTYPSRSNYQIIVKDIKLNGQGALLEMLRKRKKQLSAEGLFDLKLKKPLPRVPESIAIITSCAGAVIHDILHRVKERFPMRVLIWDVAVQGNCAAVQISRAITSLNNLPNDIPTPDMIIIARGGGSVEDLWAFNEEIMVRAAAESNIPIVSAIGHETDVTLLDLVADIRAPTPTAAVELVTPVISDLQEKVYRYGDEMQKLLINLHRFKKLHFKSVLHKFPREELILQNFLHKLETFNIEMNKGMLQLLKLSYLKFYSLDVKLEKIQTFLQRNRCRLRELSGELSKRLNGFFHTKINTVDYNGKILEGYSYKRILRRGFVIVRSFDGKLVKSSTETNVDHLELEFYDGKISTTSKSLKVSLKKR